MASSFLEHFLLAETPVLLRTGFKRRRTVSVHDVNKSRSTDGEYHHLFHQLKAYPDRFHSYTRMSLNTFDYILKKVESKLSKAWCNLHNPILPEERLVVTLRQVGLQNCNVQSMIILIHIPISFYHKSETAYLRINLELFICIVFSLN